MRHRYSGKYLSRDTEHRKSLAKNLATSLINKGTIETTLAKAKFVQPYVEKLITKAKSGSNFNTIKYLRNKLSSEGAVRNLVEKLATEFKSRNGGYTRVTKVRNRVGDQALMARIEFVKEKKAKVEKTKKSAESLEGTAE